MPLWITSLPQHDEEVTTVHVPRLLDTVLRILPTSTNPKLVTLAEALFHATSLSCWTKETDAVHARIVQNSLRLTLNPRHVLASINIGTTLLDVEVLPPMDCQQWKLDLLTVLQKVRSPWMR